MSDEPTTDPAATEAAASSAETAPTSEAIAAAPATDAPAAPATPAPPAAAAPAVPTRRTRTIALAARTLRFAFALALFGAGVAIGWQAYRANLAPPPIVGDPAIASTRTPDVVAELANAIAADDADAIRSALAQDMFSRYTSEMERFGISTVSSVDTLGTYADGPRTATALILHGSTTDNSPFNINLVVVTQNGSIVRLR
jgi:hypothetical protein